MSGKTYSILKKNPDLARRILDYQRNYVVRELNEKCPDCEVNLKASPEEDIIKYCPNGHGIWHIEDWKIEREESEERHP